MGKSKNVSGEKRTSRQISVGIDRNLSGILRELGKEMGNFLNEDPLFRKELIGAVLEDKRARMVVLEAIVEELSD